FAPSRMQKSPALTTTPPPTVPESGPLHSVPASAPPLETASTKPAIPARNPASLFIVPTRLDSGFTLNPSRKLGHGLGVPRRWSTGNPAESEAKLHGLQRVCQTALVRVL